MMCPASIQSRAMGAQWLSGRVLDSRPKGRGFEPHRRHCVVYLSKNITPSLVLVQSRKTRLFIIERLLMGRKESNQTNKTNKISGHYRPASETPFGWRFACEPIVARFYVLTGYSQVNYKDKDSTGDFGRSAEDYASL